MNGATEHLITVGTRRCPPTVLDDPDITRLYCHWRKQIEDCAETLDVMITQGWLDAAVDVWMSKHSNLPPVNQSAPDIPDRPTVIVERWTEPEPADTGGLVLWIILALALSAVVAVLFIAANGAWRI